MINLLPPERKAEFIEEDKWKLLLILGIIISVSLVCFALILFSIKIYISGQVSSYGIISDTEEKEFKSSAIYSLGEKVGAANAIISNVNDFYQKQVDFIEVFYKISGALPAGVYLRNISFNPLAEKNYKFQISISGYSPDRETLLKLKDNLEKEEFFKELYFPPSNWVTPSAIDFNLILKIQ